MIDPKVQEARDRRTKEALKNLTPDDLLRIVRTLQSGEALVPLDTIGAARLGGDRQWTLEQLLARYLPASCSR